jgi:hypothetical protein
MVMLRHHPELFGHWPSGWGGWWYERDTKTPLGEAPGKLLSVEESGSTIAFEVEYDGNEFTGHLTINDPKFRGNFLEVLNKSIGKSIKEIGSLDILF